VYAKATRPNAARYSCTGAPSAAGGGHRGRKRLLLLFKKAGGQQNAAASGPQINSRPVITRARPFRQSARAGGDPVKIL